MKDYEQGALPRVDCEARIKAEKGKSKKKETDDESIAASDDDAEPSGSSDDESDEPKKKEKKAKDKVGFRDRKVNHLVLALD